MHDLTTLRSAIVGGNVDGALSAANEALAAGAGPAAIVADGITPAMADVGRRLEQHEIFRPDMLAAARATKQVFQLLRPLFKSNGVESGGRVVLGTVQGDLHDIGKNLVSAMLEGAGFEVIDLGVDVRPVRFVMAVQEHQPQIIGLSALLTTTLPAMKRTIDALCEAGMRERVKVMIGGAPASRQYAESIGADAYGENAIVSVRLARSLVESAEHSDRGAMTHD